MEFISLILATISIILSFKVLKDVKKQCTASSPDCKNALNQKIINSIKSFDKKGKQIVYCVVKLDGDEVEHVLVNIQDLSVISVDNPGT